MTGIAGLLGRESGDPTYINTIGQALVFEAVQTYLDRVNMDMALAQSVFVERNTENYKERYKLPGGGRLARRAKGTTGGAVRAYSGWDVAYPLEDYGREVVGDYVDMAKMTLAELDRHVNTVRVQYINTSRFEMLLKLFKNTNTTFIDEDWGSLTVVPLANGDGTVYPPVLGSESEAEDTHHLESGYLATAISDTNNPYATIRDELEEHFGAMTGGENIVVFINPAETPETEALRDFDEVPDRFVRVGDNVDVPQNLPIVPGRILGRVSGCWVSEWRWMPSGYMLGIHLEAPKPLMRRIDPVAQGLPSGLSLISTDQRYPFVGSNWGVRFGFGVGNRLNGVVMELANGGTYTIPTAYQ